MLKLKCRGKNCKEEFIPFKRNGITITRFCKTCQHNREMIKNKEARIKETKRKLKERKYNSPTKIKERKDQQWRKEVKDLYGDRCVICGSKERTNIHHYIGRRNLAVRWYPPNGVPLCPSHHVYGIQSAHQNPLWFQDKMIVLRGQYWLDDLRNQSNKPYD